MFQFTFLTTLLSRRYIKKDVQFNETKRKSVSVDELGSKETKCREDASDFRHME